MKKRILAILTVLVMILSVLPLSASASVTNGHTHTWGSWNVIQKATCTEKGVRVRYCTTCTTGVQKGTYGPTEHKYKIVKETPGTCVEPGTILKSCKYCGTTRLVETELGDHSFGEWFEPEGRTGVRERDCELCGLQEYDYFPVPELTLTEVSEPANGEAYAAGEILKLRMDVTNKGEGTASGGSFLLYGETYPCSDLQCGESASCTVEYEITPSDAGALSVVRQARYQCDGPSDVFSNILTIPTGNADPLEGCVLSLVAEAVSVPSAFPPYAIPGTTVTVTYAATNNGDAILTLPEFSIADKNGKYPGCTILDTSVNSTWLMPGETATATISYPLLTKDIEDKEMVRSFTFIAKPWVDITTGVPATPESTGGHYTGGVSFSSNTVTVSVLHPSLAYTSALASEIASAPAGFPQTVGSTVTVSYTLRNTGETCLTVPQFSVKDGKGSWCFSNTEIVSFPNSLQFFMPQATDTVVLKFSVTQDDIDAGEMIRSVVFTAMPWVEVSTGIPATPDYLHGKFECGPEVNSNTSTFKLLANGRPDYSVTKTVKNEPKNGLYYLPDEEIVYEIVISNNGKSDATNLAVSDVSYPGMESWTDTIDLLPAGESKTYPGLIHTVTEEDGLYGCVENHVSVTADAHADPVTASAISKCRADDPNLLVNKYVINTPANTLFYTPGETIRYEIEVINHSKTAFDYISVYDPIISPVNVAEFNTPLEPDENVLCQVDYIVTEDDADKGFAHNIAYATNEYPNSSMASDDVYVPCGRDTYAIEAVKTCETEPDNGSFFVEGEKVVFRITAVNKSTCALSGIRVYDPDISTKALFKAEGPFDPDCTIGSWTVEYTVTKGDVETGLFCNVAYLTAKETDELFYTNDVLFSCGENPRPKLSITKKATSTPANGLGYYEENETVTYLIKVTNTGNVDLTGITVYDSLKQTDGGVIGTSDLLHPGESISCNYAQAVDWFDVDRGYLDNYARAEFSSELGFDLAVSNTVRVDTDSVPDPEPTGEFDPTEGSFCSMEFLPDGGLLFSRCPEHEAVEAESLLKDDPAEARALWQKALNDEYDLYFSLGNGPAKAALLEERAYFNSFLKVREHALAAKYPNDPDAVNALMTELLREKVILMCYELHTAPAERTGFSEAVTGSTEAACMSVMNDSYAALENDAFNKDYSFFTAWLKARGCLLKVLYPEDGSAVQKALEQEMLANARILDTLR